MSAIMSLIIGHFLTIVENELINDEPALVNLVVQEVQLVINKLEKLIEGKSPTVAQAVNPVLTNVANIASNVVEAAGAAAVATQ